MQGTHQIPAKAGIAHSEMLSRDLRIVPWNVPLSCSILMIERNGFEGEENLLLGNCTK